jgi:hypothetical protein
VALIADRWIATPRKIKQKSLEGIFNSRPLRAGAWAAGATISALQRSAAGDAGGVGAQLA